MLNYTLGTIEASEALIKDLYIDLRAKVNAWSKITQQTPQARMGYVGQHLVSVVTGYHHMNEDWTNEGGWLACDMRRYLNEEVIALLPDALIAAIKPRKFGEEEDKLWLFSEMEVFGDHDWTENDPDRGFQFEYFKDRRNRIKVDEDGDASWWWERSPYGSDSNGFCSVDSSGDADISGASYAYGVCFGFYI